MNKKKRYEVSEAFLFTGIIPAVQFGELLFWFNDIWVRDQFIEKLLCKYDPNEWEKTYIHIDDVHQMDLLMGKFIFKVGKKKIRSVPLGMVYEFYQQAGYKVVDKS